MGSFTRAALVLGVTLAGSVAAVFGADALRGAGYLPEPDATASAGAEAEAETAMLSATPYDRFIQASDLENRAAAANAACGFGESLAAGGSQFQLVGDAPGVLGLYQAQPGEGQVLRSFTAPADMLVAYSEYGELYVQTGDGAFNSRTFVLDDTGEVIFTEPLLERARIVLTCEDAPAAATQLNTLFRASGPAMDPIRSGLNAFVVGDGYEDWQTPPVEGLVEACTPEGGAAALEDGQTTLLAAEFDAEARFGEAIFHEMSGGSLEGSSEPMLYLTLGTVHRATEHGEITYYRAPLSWRDLVAGEHAFSLFYRYEAMEQIGFAVFADGARSHSESAGGVRDASFPCADPERAVEILRAVSAR